MIGDVAALWKARAAAAPLIAPTIIPPTTSTAETAIASTLCCTYPASGRPVLVGLLAGQRDDQVHERPDAEAAEVSSLAMPVPILPR